MCLPIVSFVHIVCAMVFYAVAQCRALRGDEAMAEGKTFSTDRDHQRLLGSRGGRQDTSLANSNSSVKVIFTLQSSLFVLKHCMCSVTFSHLYTAVISMLQALL